MDEFKGACALCVNDKKEVLMVLQGKEDEVATWSLPSGKLEIGESYEECCKREVLEETGYEVDVIRHIHTKDKPVTFGTETINTFVKYYLVEVTSGEMGINDPDNLIHDIKWQSLDDIEHLNLTYSEDKKIIDAFLNEHDMA